MNSCFRNNFFSSKTLSLSSFSLAGLFLFIACFCFETHTEDLVQDSAQDRVITKQEHKTKHKNKNLKLKNLELIDKISVIIYTDEQPIVITESDIKRLSINGALQTKSSVILERIMEHEALFVYKMPVPEEGIKKYLESIKKQNNLTDQQVKDMFKEAGYTYQEGIEQLQMISLIDSLLNFKIKARLVVTEEAIRDYYDKHTQNVTASYKIQKGFIPTGLFTQEELENWAVTSKNLVGVTWSEPDWWQEDEIAPARMFVTNMSEGEISEPEIYQEGLQVIKLLKKKQAHARTFEERYKEITDILRAPLFEQMYKDYQKELLAKYEIVYF